MRIKRASRGVMAAALPALALALCVAACGGSSSPKPAARAASTTTTTTTTTTDPGGTNAAFTACLKQHGVTLPAGRGRFRGGGGGGFFGGGGGQGTGTDTTPSGSSGASPAGQRPPSGGGQGPPNGGGFFRGNSKFTKAFQACAKDLPAGARGRFGSGSGRGFRRPGYSAATLNRFAACVKQHGYTLPKPNTSGSGPVYPSSIEHNKQFQAAAKKCESILTSGFRGRPGGAPPGGTTGTSTTASS